VGTYIFGVSWPGRSPAGGQLGYMHIVDILAFTFTVWLWACSLISLYLWRVNAMRSAACVLC
jgi:hypothetical protein